MKAFSSDDALDAVALARIAQDQPPLEEGKASVDAILGDRDEAGLISLVWCQAQLLASVVRDWHAASERIVKELGGNPADLDSVDDMLDEIRDIVLEVTQDDS